MRSWKDDQGGIHNAAKCQAFGALFYKDQAVSNAVHDIIQSYRESISGQRKTSAGKVRSNDHKQICDPIHLSTTKNFHHRQRSDPSGCKNIEKDSRQKQVKKPEDLSTTRTIVFLGTSSRCWTLANPQTCLRQNATSAPRILLPITMPRNYQRKRLHSICYIGHHTITP